MSKLEQQQNVFTFRRNVENQITYESFTSYVYFLLQGKLFSSNFDITKTLHREQRTGTFIHFFSFLQTYREGKVGGRGIYIRRAREFS